MAELLLVNPRRRKRRSTHAKRKRRAHSSPRRIRRRRARALIASPRRRRRRAHAHRASRRRRNPSLRNIGGSLRSNLLPSLKAGFMGSLGGLGVDILLGQVLAKLPLSLQTGWGKVGVKLLAALGVGMLGSYVFKGRGRDLTVGAMTVTLHDVLKEQFVGVFPSIPLGEYLTFAPVMGYDTSGAALPGTTGMGEYVSDYVTGAGSGVAYDSDVYGGY